MFCQKCGTELPEKSEFCHKCGANQTAPKATQPSANIQEAETRQSVSTDINAFKNFVDNHVRTTTKFSSAEDLLKNSKPWRFVWICFGAATLVGLLTGPGVLLIGPLFGYSILPMTSPVTGHIVFEVPTNVSESDKSLVLNFGDGYGNNLLSYVLR